MATPWWLDVAEGGQVPQNLGFGCQGLSPWYVEGGPQEERTFIHRWGSLLGLFVSQFSIHHTNWKIRIRPICLVLCRTSHSSTNKAELFPMQEIFAGQCETAVFRETLGATLGSEQCWPIHSQTSCAIWPSEQRQPPKSGCQKTLTVVNCVSLASEFIRKQVSAVLIRNKS